MLKTLQTSVLVRALGEKGYKSIEEQYIGARLRSKTTTRPTDKQIRLASLVKKVGYKDAAKQVGTDVSQAYSAVGRVSKWTWLTGEKLGH